MVPSITSLVRRRFSGHLYPAPLDTISWSSQAALKVAARERLWCGLLKQYIRIPGKYRWPGLFLHRVQAIIPGCPEPGPAWSNTYVYCPQEVVCNPVITVCGCCSGNYRSEEMSGLPTTIVSEEEVLAIIKANPGSEYVTLRDALNAAGTNVKAELEFNVFPNPASDQIVVKAGNTVKGTFKVQVTDLLQREWRNESFDAAGEKTLNISDLPNGIYLVTIRNARGDQMMTEKIVVMK
jgi:hypothetical protein